MHIYIYIYNMPRRKNYRKNFRKKPHRKYYKKKAKYTRIQSTVVKQPGVIVSDRTFVRLNYLDSTSTKLSSAGNTYGYIRYYANGLYDVNPLLLTSAVPGFNEMMALYENYRVRGCLLKLTFTNQEAVPSIVLVWPTDQDQTTSVNYQYLQEMVGNAYARYKAVSAKGGMDRGVLKLYISFKKLLGTTNILTSPDYTGTSTTNPSKLMYFNIGAYTMDGSAYTSNSLPFEARLTFYTEFFNRRQLTS